MQNLLSIVELYTTIKHAIFDFNLERSYYNPPCWQITAQFLQMADDNQHEGRGPPQPSRRSRASHKVGSDLLYVNTSLNHLTRNHLFWCFCNGGCDWLVLSL